MMEIFQYGKKETDYLKKMDSRLGEAIDRIGPIEREVFPDLFGALVNSIVGQQITTRAQVTIWNRIKEGLGEITPDTILDCGEDTLQSFGLSYRKVRYMREAAKQIRDGQLQLDGLKDLSDEEVCHALVKLPGVGVWTAEMLMTFSMQRPDIVSFGDLAILRGMRMLYGQSEINREKFQAYRSQYSPYGTVASLYLWAIAGCAVKEWKDSAPDKNKQNNVDCFYYDVIHTSLGDFTIVCDESAVTSLEFGHVIPDQGQEMRTELIKKAEQQLLEYADRKRKTFDLPLRPHGTPFQKKVWDALRTIPYGETRSYKEIAVMAGSPKGFRAVGMANNRNPIPVLIPCHRVIGADGSYVGYGGGLEMKKKLLELEKGQV